MSCLPKTWTTNGQLDMNKFTDWLTGDKALYLLDTARSAEESDRAWSAIMTTESVIQTGLPSAQKDT
jgi:hypothetical protein